MSEFIIEKRLLLNDSNILLKTDSERAVKEAGGELALQRSKLESYLEKDPEFQTSLEPYAAGDDAPEIAKLLETSARAAGTVGPMAAVAGTFSELILKRMLKAGAKYAVVENGGDIAMKVNREARVSVYAGKSGFSEKIGFLVKAEETPLGICTSAGTVGHSISFGKADAVVAFHESASVADACATAIANEVGKEEGVQKALEFAKKIPSKGVVILRRGELAAWGKIPEIIEIK